VNLFQHLKKVYRGRKEGRKEGGKGGGDNVM